MTAPSRTPSFADGFDFSRCDKATQAAGQSLLYKVRELELALAALREDVDTIVRREGGRRGGRVADAVDRRFAAATFPFAADRLIPRIAVSGSAGEISLEAGLRNPKPWADEAKLELIARGYRMLDDELRERAVA